MLLSNSENSHYVLIIDFNRFMINKTKGHRKKDFCRYCFQYVLISRVLKCRIKNCPAFNHAKSVLLPEENEYVIFQNFERLTKASFIIYIDFELTVNTDFGPNTNKISRSYCLQLYLQMRMC